MFQVPKSFKFFSLVCAFPPSKIKAGADKELYACGEQQWDLRVVKSDNEKTTTSQLTS